jgi:hypothetical protein
MGHASIVITYDLCGHLLPGDQTAAADLLHGFLNRAKAA